MKQIVPLFCMTLIAAPLMVAPAEVMAGTLSPLAVVEHNHVVKAAWYGPRRDRDNRRGGDNDDDRGENRRENRNDDRIGDAIAIASRRGDVINAWPAGGSLFKVRVSTSQGRKDVYVDMNCRCIVREE